MSINPEFRRNLWLELTPQRLIGMPLVLGALFLLAFTVSGQQFGQGVASTAAVIFGVLSILWGTKLAGESVSSEIREHTWDGQRMSVIGPWSMTWGKLFGSTIFPWYGAVICLIVYAIASPAGADDLLKRIAVMAGAGLTGQAVALFSSLLATRRSRRFSRSQTAGFSILGIMAALLPVSFGLQGYGRIAWYGNVYSPLEFILLSLALFLFWALVGAYRLMRLELQMRSAPWVWPAFLIFTVAYMAGFSPGAGAGLELSFSGRLLGAFFILVILTYAGALVEPKDPMRFRRLLTAWKKRESALLLQLCPSWIPALSLVIISAAILFASPPGYRSDDDTFRMAMAAMPFFILRDLALVVFFNLAKNRKRADMLALLWLGLLWLVIPMTLSGLGLAEPAQLFRPDTTKASPAILLAAPLQMFLAVWLVVRRWRANWG